MINSAEAIVTSYNGSEYDSAIKSCIANEGEGVGLAVFLGPYKADKQKSLDYIRDNSSYTIELVETKDFIKDSMNETRTNLDELFAGAGADTLFYFVNGDKLCGAYTGFTQSKVKYATPQEKYFFEKLKAFEGMVILDISDEDAADETVLRAAQVVISYPLPKSPLARFTYGLKNYTFHGYNIKTKRPDHYAA